MNIIALIPWYIYTGASAGLVSLSSIWSKKVLLREHALQFSVAINMYYGVTALPLLFFTDLAAIGKVWEWILVATILGAVGGIFLNKAMRHMELSSVMPLFNLSTLLSVLIAILFLGEVFSAIKGIGIALMILGTFFIEHSQGPFNITFKNRVNWYPFIPIVLFSAMHVINKKALENIDVISFFVATTFFYIIFYFAASFLMYRHVQNDLYDSFKKDKKILFGVSATSIASDFAYYIALSVAPVSVVLPVLRTHSLITVIAGGKYFHDHKLPLRILSTIIILGGLYLILI